MVTVFITCRAYTFGSVKDTAMRNNKTGSRIIVRILDDVQEVKEAVRNQRTAFI